MSITFTYDAVDAHGKRKRGYIDADNRDQAIKALKMKGLQPTNIIELGEFIKDESAFGPQVLLDSIGFTFVNQKAMAMYTRKFASMMKAGLSYIEIFDILSMENENRRLRYVSTRIKEYLIKGDKINDALSRFPTVFTKVYRSMVQVGEATGRLDDIMNRLADMYDREFEIRSNIRSKLYFPVIYLIVGLVLIAGVIFFVPRFIPGTDQIFNLGTFLAVIKSYAFIGLLVLIARTQVGYRIFRNILSVIPPFSGLMRKMSLARFSRLFATMYGAGVSVITGLDIAGETLMEADLQHGLKHIKARINRGDSLYEAISSSRVFPPSLRGMVRTGETSGNVEDVLNKLAEYYEMDIDTQSSMLASLFTILVYLIILLTLAIFVIQAWSNYFGIVDSLINENS